MNAGFIKPFLMTATLLLAVVPGLEAQEAQAAPQDATAPAPKAPAKPAQKPVGKSVVVAPPAATAPATRPPRRPTGKHAKPKKLPYEDRTDLNSASKEELMKLPGVTGEYAAKIIAGRPYRSKAALVVEHVIPTTVYYLIKDKVAAGKAPAKP